MTNLVEVSIPSLQMAEDELISVLESSIYPGAKIQSIKLAVGYCKANRLDPMTKPVHIVGMRVKQKNPTTNKFEYVWRDVIMAGIELYRTKAARTGEYAGIDDAEFGPTIADDKEVGIPYPEWCRVTVYRLVQGEPRPFSSGRVYWKETYATTGGEDEDGSRSAKPNRMWNKRAFGQLEKCAEAMALRRGFPEIGAEPTREEMEGKVIEHDITPAAPQIEGVRRKDPPKPEGAPPQESQRAPDVQQEQQTQQATKERRPVSAGFVKTIQGKIKGLVAMGKGAEEEITEKLLKHVKAQSLAAMDTEQAIAAQTYLAKLAE